MTTFASPRWRCAAWIVATIKLWLVAGIPIFAIGGAGHDDRLFLSLAEQIARGNWLGPYHQLTLAKGPFYSIWIAANSWTGLPLFFTQHLAYALACWLAARALQPLHRRDAITFAVFALLLWNPMSYEGVTLARVLRQNISTPLAVMIFAAAIALHTRNNQTFRSLAGWSVLLGAAFSAFWLTREEGIWIVPSVVLLVGCAAFLAWKQGKAALRALGGALGVAVLCAAIPLLTVCALNHRHYGWFGTVEFRAPEFIDAHGALTRVTPIGAVPPFVPVTRETRLRIYEISPAFAELKPFLEGDSGRGWAYCSIGLTRLREEDYEIAGGWFVWALRDAVTLAGHGRSAGDAIAFYGRIAREVNAACDAGRIVAGPRRSSLMPRWRPENTKLFGPALLEHADYFASFREFRVGDTASAGDAELLALFRDFTRGRLSRSPDAPEVALPQQDRVDKFKVDALRRIGKSVRRPLFAFVLLGLALWAARGAHIIFTRRPTYTWWLASAALGACLASLLVLTLVHITSFPALNVTYLASAYPLLILFAAVAALDAALAWFPRLRNGARPAASASALQPNASS